MTAAVKLIQRFPIKGLSPERLDHVTLTAGEGIPDDRLFGFARHGSGFDPAAPKPIPKDKFVVLLNQAALAGLQTEFDAQTRVFQVRARREVHVFNLGSVDGRQNASAWLAAYLALEDPAPPQFVSSAPHRFTDVSVVSPQMMNAVSLLNHASVRDLGDRLGTSIDPARFRANIEFDGLPAWWELSHVGSTLRIGDVELRLIKRTQRCAATEVNPETAARDLRLPYLLRKEFGHMDMGVYAEVVRGGALSPDLPISIQ